MAIFAVFLGSVQFSMAAVQPCPHTHRYSTKCRPSQHATPHHKHRVRSPASRQQIQKLTIPISLPTPGLISKLGTRMVQFVHSTISTLRYTAYKWGGTHFDSSHGIYIVDCSDYVDHLLQVSNPSAYNSLVNSSGSDKPTSEHYYHFFTGLTYKRRHYWNKVENVKELQPGDILVFRNKKNSHTGVSGHVMVVMNKPIRIQDAFLVRVTDSASSGHSQDTRLPHTSGIGIGTMQLKVNPDTGQPSAYAWKLGSPFERHVNFAMARPVGG
ncbi:MAG: hypothetical protein K0S27_1085 [Gammaproteobacteria bacterium]|nr:hypothetical protein [Gammaproteobacteria bacterium]